MIRDVIRGMYTHVHKYTATGTVSNTCISIIRYESIGDYLGTAYICYLFIRTCIPQWVLIRDNLWSLFKYKSHYLIVPTNVERKDISSVDLYNRI